MRSKRQLVAASGNGLVLVQAIFRRFACRTFATGCAPSVPQLFHPNRPKGAHFEAGTATAIGDRLLPLLPMRLDWQSVAAHGNGFGLFLPFLENRGA
jgi:hypothetical protein